MQDGGKRKRSDKKDHNMMLYMTVTNVTNTHITVIQSYDVREEHKRF